MSTLTGTIDELLTPRLLGSLAARSGISDTKVKSGLNGAIASILDGLAGKANDTRAMGQITELIQRTPESFDVDSLLDDRGSLHRSGEQLLDVATPSPSSLTSRLSKFLGVGMSSATGLVAAAAGLAMTAFRRFASARGGLDPQTLSTMLRGEQQAIHAAVPAELTMPILVDDRHINGVSRRVHVPVHRAKSRAWMWLIPLALLALWGIMRMRNRDHVRPVAAPMVKEPVREPVREPVVTPIEPKHEMLPEPGVAEPPAVEPRPVEPPVVAPTPPPAAVLSFAAGTAEAAFLAQVQAPSTADESKWFELTEVEYDTGSASIRPGATEQLAHIADVLKANPMIRVKVGGYTDGTGTAAANEKLSDARAESVRGALVANGVAADRIETEGYGEQHKRVETAGAAQSNRRAAIRIVSR